MKHIKLTVERIEEMSRNVDLLPLGDHTKECLKMQLEAYESALSTYKFMVYFSMALVVVLFASTMILAIMMLYLANQGAF